MIRMKKTLLSHFLLNILATGGIFVQSNLQEGVDISLKAIYSYKVNRFLKKRKNYEKDNN